MIRKFGKRIDLHMIKRNLSEISELNQECKRSADKYGLDDSTSRNCCIICGSSRRQLFLTAYEKYKYYECLDCGALILEKFPEVKQMYASEETENLGIYIDESIYNRRVSIITKPKVDFVIDVLKQWGEEPMSWLDIGCGGGELLYYLKNNSKIKGVGIESDESEWRFCQKKELDVYKKYIDVNNEAAEVTDLINSNNIVSLFNVLEHIEEPTKYVEYLYTRMKKGSYLIIEVPKHPSLGSFANLTSMDNIYRHIVPPVHLQIFSIKSLEILLSSKFEIVATWEFGQGFMDVINNAMIISETQTCDLYNMILDKQDSIQKTIDEAGLSDQILIIARKM